jgi:hypothetical protein
MIEDLKSKNGGRPLWYRGAGLATHKLIPTLFRHKKTSDAKGFAALEQNLITRFRQRSIPYHDRDLSDEWNNLFFMQHYGVPTRLLDWSESPFVAAHFAVMSGKFKTTASDKIRYSAPAAVWVLDPVKWNRHSLNHQSFSGGILTPSDDSIKGYKPAPVYDGMNNHPVALYGAHNSPRIVAQKGAFTIFGQNLVPMEEAFSKENYPIGCLTKIKLSSQALPLIRKSILEHGITESSIYPDLVGLASEIRRSFRF